MRSDLPTLGVGLGYRPEYHDAILRHSDHLDFIEVITEHLFAEPGRGSLERFAEVLPTTCHGLQLSLGSAEPLDGGYVDRVCEAIGRFRPPWFSDHLSLTRIDGVDLGHLAPVAFTEEILEAVCDKIATLRKRISTTFLIENIAYYFPIPGSQLTEADFLARVVERTDSGILLDLNNLYANAENMGYDPYGFLDAIPLERVVEIHLAGGALRDGLFVDTHGHPVCEEVWELLEFVCRRASVKGIVLERDQNIPHFEELTAELRRARRILSGGQ
jgi:uncharacterized protein